MDEIASSPRRSDSATWVRGHDAYAPMPAGSGLPARTRLRVLKPARERRQAAEPAPLIERGLELDVLGGAVARLAGGTGGVVVLEAPAGLGKTVLLDHAAQLASRAGSLVRRAAPGLADRHFPFGVVRALLEAPVRDAEPGERARLLAGAAASAGALLQEGTVPGGDTTTTIAHSVLWLCAALADTRPLMFVVDDAHWADRSSLAVLSYLARRIDDLPLLIAVAARADDPDAPADLLSTLGGVPSATVLQPQPLTPSGAMQMIRRAAPDAPAELCNDSRLAVDGNPWLLSELGRQIAAHGPDALGTTVEDTPQPGSDARTVVRRRLAALAPGDRRVAAAIAVLGDAVPSYVVAAVAGIPLGALSTARDSLRVAGLLDASGERFAHPLIATAIGVELPRSERERLHREAARALAASGADAEVVASHLLESPADRDPEVSTLLSAAAASAVERGAPDVAAAFLSRALDEQAVRDDRGRILACLATVAFDAGLPDSGKLLREALESARDRESRADVLMRLAALNVVDVADAGLAELFERELAIETDPDLRLAVEVAALDTLMMLPDRQEERARRIAAIDTSATADPLLRDSVTAHRAWLATERGTPDAAVIASEALRGGALLAAAGRRSGFHLALRTLVMSGHAEEASVALADLREHASVHGSLRMQIAAEWYSSELALRTARVAAAENDARLALELVEEDVNVFTGGAIEVLVCALAERGAFQEAHELLARRELDGPLGRSGWEVGVRHARARLSLAEGDFERAYAEAIEVGTLREEQGRPNPAWTPWRSTASLALSHLGRRDEAAVLADAELQLAERFGAPGPIAGALHARAVAEPDPEVRLTFCRRALAAAADGPPQLAVIRVRLEIGSTLASLGRRVEARDALRPALADADAAGAVLLAERARRELVATGLRPRRAALEGAASLTPRQRQICELAAAGKGNRAIAQELFLSIKTVETHLAAGYRKLGVNTRADLARELAA